MNILFLMISFPDIKKSTNLYADLAIEFQRNGHNVWIATLLENKYGEETYFEEVNGLKILHVRAGDWFNTNSVIKKGITTVTIPHYFKNALKQYFKNIKCDLVIYPTPPITFAPVVKYIKNRDGCKSYLILRDIFPQNVRDLGLMNNNLLFSYFRKKEQQLYNISDYIGCMSEGNIEYVLTSNKVERNKMEILYNWGKNNSNILSSEINIRKKYNLEGKFIAVFGGNIGLPQELDFLLELAKEYQSVKDIIFLIIGKGAQKQKIIEIVKKENITNVIMKDHMHRDEYNLLLSECDIGLINLDRRFTIPNIPSKTVDYFKMGIPILASTDKNTDYRKLLVEKVKAGLWSETGDLENYKRNFERLYQDENLRKQLGHNGKEFFKKYLTVERAYQTIMNHF